MTFFLLRRLAQFVATLLAISIIVFAVMNVLPGDPALTILGIDASEEARLALTRELGLDAPAWQRYLDWIGGVLRGDFGTSYSFDVPVAGLIAERLPVTLSLAVSGMAVTLVIALGAGIFAASRHGRPGDWAVMVASQLGIAVPAFWLAILLVILFAVKLRWLPPGGFPGWDDPLAAIRALILPTISLALVQAAVLTRVTRSAALDVMRLDFMRTARATGLSPRRILWRHLLPNALVPIVTIVGMQFAGVVTGTLVIESVFYLPGLGRLIFQSISARDLIVVESVIMLIVFAVIVINFAVDLAYALIDPRLRART